MIGTIVNTCTIIAGGIVGALLHRGIKEKYKNVLYDSLGLASIAIGLNATISHLGGSEYPVLFIVSIALGGVVGTRLDLNGRFHRLVDKFQKRGSTRTGQDPDPTREAASTDKTSRGNLADGLATACLLYCIGPLSMLGPVISALQGDHTFLFTNATLDLVSSLVFASTYGIGMILAAPVLFCWQGAFWLVAKLSSSAVSDALMSELLIVGGLMIVASGLNLLRIKDCKVLNLLPSLLVPIAFFFLKWLF